MIVTWIAIQSQPLPWEECRTDVAYVACGDRAGQLSLVLPEGRPATPGLDRLIESLERAIQAERDRPNLTWLWRSMPDQGTSIRLSPPQRCQVSTYEEGIGRLATGHLLD